MSLRFKDNVTSQEVKQLSLVGLISNSDRARLLREVNRRKSISKAIHRPKRCTITLPDTERFLVEQAIERSNEFAALID